MKCSITNFIILGVVISSYFHIGNGCAIVGVTSWHVPIIESILDTHKGIIFDNATTNIEDITNIVYGEGLNDGPYVSLKLINNHLTLSTTANFESYEEKETEESFSFTVTFQCSSGSPEFLTFVINIQDTNNNDPQFWQNGLTVKNYEFVVMPPLPPGFLITDCVNDLIVRDIDLTTEGIDFTVRGSSLFEVAYDTEFIAPKKFKAALRTTTLVRSISEPIIFTIDATDIDRTNDPRRTSSATVKILASNEFEFPDEPIFSQPFYMASYNSEQGFVLQDSIYLSQGYDKHVTFDFQTKYSQYFKLVADENLVSFVVNDLPEELYEERQIFVVVEAKREYTSGATSVVILELPDSEPDTIAQFDDIFYKGKIENEVIYHDAITISNYTGSSIDLSGDYASFFETSLTDGIVIVQLRLSAIIPSGLKQVILNLQAETARAVLLLEIVNSDSEPDTIAQFDDIFYKGKIENEVIYHDAITISNYTGSSIDLSGDYASFFETSLTDGKVIVQLRPSAIIPSGLKQVILNLQAETARAVLLLEIVNSDSEPDTIEQFDDIFYKGKIENQVVTHDTITVLNYAGSSIDLSGVYASLFDTSLTDGKVLVQLRPSAIIPSGLKQVILYLQAERAKAVLSLEMANSDSEPDTIEQFDNIFYMGKIENEVVSHDTIIIANYTGSSIDLSGVYASFFETSLTESKVLVQLRPSAIIPSGLKQVILNLQAERARAVLSLEMASSDSEPDTIEQFDNIFYTGKIDNEVVSHGSIIISNYAGSSIDLSGVYASFFETSLTEGKVLVQLRPSAVIPSGLKHTILNLQAERARAVLLLEMANSDSEPDTIEQFDNIFYTGKIENEVVSHGSIIISNYAGSSIGLSGVYASLFETSLTDGKVLVQLQPLAEIPSGLKHTILNLQAERARAVLLLEMANSDSEPDTIERFDNIFYTGKIENEVVTHDTIIISNYAGSSIGLSGVYASLFETSLTDGKVIVQLRPSAIIPSGLKQVILNLQAETARAVLLLEIVNSDSTNEAREDFDKILYYGQFENGLISHETIFIYNFNGTNAALYGEYASNFEASFTNGILLVKTRTSNIFPTNLTHTTLILQAGQAEAVLLLDIFISEENNKPVVTFDTPSYFLWADVDQVGVIGRVQATESNGNLIKYSLTVVDDHLRSRISVNDGGFILLSESAQVGIHRFSVTATAQNSQASATASVLLRIDTLPECSSEDGLPPLIILERLEEEPHRNLVTLNRTKYTDCQYSLSNVWPENQSWLYVDEDGLHAKAIDREDKSIALMTLSQIQVELRLQCDNDEVPATRRSLTAERLPLGSDNYGSNKWILADSIVYDERRSFVNLIVHDINDNPPIFMGKEKEPIYIGYPIPEIEDIILPRALTELKATDADIGENAALMYSSTEEVLAVAPYTGLVHVRNNAQLQNNSRLTIYATDQNGRGRVGSIDIMIKLLDRQQIAVLTIQDAFLDDENLVVTEVINAVGYEIKVIRSVVISYNSEPLKSRKMRNSFGASLQLYIYGLLENEPVDVAKLTNDITSSNLATVNIVRAVTFQEYVQNSEQCALVEPDTGLLIATIVLAILLFTLIIPILIWFYLKWRKERNYDNFSDRNSIVSLETRNFPKIETVTKPRLNIGELKRSERRLQEMLDIPIQNVKMEPENESNNNNNVELPVPGEAIVNFTTPEMPIVIQSIDKLKDDIESDDNDEFGEQKQKPRKSVVTFNENVEKIIHLEDGIEETPEAEYEIFKF